MPKRCNSAISSSTNNSKLKRTYSNTSQKTLPNIQVKQNITQILREGAQIRKKNDKTKQLLDDLCTGSFDPYKIHILLNDIKKQQYEEELHEIKKKHLMGKITLEEAKIAKLEQLKLNKEHVLELKTQKLKLDIKLSAYRQNELQRIQELVEKCRESWEIAKQAQACLLDKKKEIVKSIREQSIRHSEIIRIRKRKELEQKIILIRQIKELERVSKNSNNNNNKLSLNTNLNNINISSMSVNELHESLMKLKKNLEEDLQIRRNKIREEKLRQQKLILKTKNQIEHYKGIKKISASLNKPQTKIGPHLKITPDIRELQQTLNIKKQKIQNIQRML